MSLFVCDTCGAEENTALAGPRGFHLRNMELSDEDREKHPDWVEAGLGDGKARCSECNPEVGRWHGFWKKKVWKPGDSAVRNRP